MAGRLAGKVAVITGGCGAIGTAIAKCFCREEARVVLVDSDASKWPQVSQELPAGSEGAEFVLADVCDEAQVRKAMDGIVDAHGGIDILVATVGGSKDALIHKMTNEQWDTVMEVNLRSTFLCCREAVPRMMERGYGKIVCMSSRSAEGNIGQVNYSAAKAGAIGFTRSLAREMARYGINVNCVAPGFVDSPRLSSMPEKYRQMRIDLNPFRTPAHPEDVADVVLFLASDESRQVTGQTIRVASW